MFLSSCLPGRRLFCRVAGACALALGLAACGGSDQVDPFSPNRIVVFGDESSVLTADGRKYTVNALDDDGALDCVDNPLWVQLLAESFGPRFPQCNPADLAAPNLNYAAVNAKVADVAAQMEQHLASNTLSNKDLVTIYAGLHDVLELYASYPTVGADELVAQSEARGAALARVVNRAANAGGRVLILTLPNPAVTPWGVRQDQVNADRRPLLSRMAERFNAGMRVGLLNDSGHRIGLVDAADLIVYRFNYPETLSLANVTEGACDLPAGTPTTACTSSTLKKNVDGSALANEDTWLWADDYLWSPIGHRQIGAIANSRARNNPF